MSDYQAIYDAVRSRLSTGDVGSAVESAFRAEAQGLSWAISRCADNFEYAVARYNDPHVMMRPKIFRDGDQWCCLYGDNLEEGVAGFGDSPSLAANAFDTAWITNIKEARQ